MWLIWAFPLYLMACWVVFNFAGWAFCHITSRLKPVSYWRPEPFSWRLLLGPKRYFAHFYPSSRS